MPVECALFEHNVTADPDDYAAAVQISGSGDGDAEGDRGGSPKVQDIIDRGQRVNPAWALHAGRYFGMVEFFPRIKGVFTSPTDSFYPPRHDIDVGAVGTGGGKVDEKAV